MEPLWFHIENNTICYGGKNESSITGFKIQLRCV